jgi:hypothetical protein
MVGLKWGVRFMIPDFNEYGCLPKGIHAATLEEVARRFGTESELRRVQMDSLRWLVDLARVAGVQRIILNGSFTTDAAEPNDVDCLLLIGPGFPHDSSAEDELRRGLPFLDIQLVELRDFVFYSESFYATDRFSVPKGMLEIVP